MNPSSVLFDAAFSALSDGRKKNQSNNSGFLTATRARRVNERKKLISELTREWNQLKIDETFLRAEAKKAREDYLNLEQATKLKATTGGCNSILDHARNLGANFFNELDISHLKETERKKNEAADEMKECITQIQERIKLVEAEITREQDAEQNEKPLVDALKQKYDAAYDGCERLYNATLNDMTKKTEQEVMLQRRTYQEHVSFFEVWQGSREKIKAREERKRKGLADNTKTEQETGFVCPASAESDEDDDYYREAGSKVPSLGLNRK
ncbi:MAG: hypothetical protein A3E84_02090 [Gammaproteobacteria bacterium RIFCSPHIGHO2_12_FULL_42_13]|nr:MAG: hypothetical protein A3E84_02090 [Gammaproteobacteria bacterium RIFCSPHIGHO2_12_FULL_42_13]